MRTRKALAGALAISLLVASCGDDDDTSDDGTSLSDGATDDTTADTSTDTTAAAGDDDGGDAEGAAAAEVIETYADGVHASYAESLSLAEDMDAAIDAFLADPTDATLDAAKTAWLDARDVYGQTEAYRFYGGPIDNEEDGPEGLINAWPMDEGYVDYVEGDPEAGIVNDPETYPTIDADLLTSLNEDGGETNISTGWHAIEFLLWGQDLAEDGPGARPVTDYTEAANADRRGTYLAVASDLLLEHLGSLVDAWDPAGSDNYRATFLALDENEALTFIITGIGELSRGELAGERMTVAYEAREQEDEHSCFSDNTHADVVANAQGILNVVTGTYPGGVSGPGLADLVAGTDADLSATLLAQVEESVANAEAIPAPFDAALRDGVADYDPSRVAILTTIDSLSVQTDTIVDAADALGVTIEVS